MRKVESCFGFASRILPSLVAVVCVMAALPTYAHNHVHRWSFNGDYSDSVGTLDATGTSSLTFSDGMVNLPGGSKGTSYVTLGENAFSVGSDNITIEIWAQQNQAVNFARLFEYYAGTDKNNDIYMSWSTGANFTSDKVEVKSGGQVKFGVTNTMQPYRQGEKFHISMTFCTNANGSTTVSWAKRNTTSGVVEKSSSQTISSWTLSSFHTLAGSPRLYLGYSLYGEADPKASYDEVRISSGVIGAEQLTANAILGPDVAVSSGTDNATGFTIPANATFNFPDGAYAGNAFTVTGTVTLESGAKIVFDTANTSRALMTFSAGGYSLPSGVSSILDMVELTDSTRYEATLSGSTITVTPKNVATWTGAAGDGNWQTPGNWVDGKVPDAGTTVTISGSAVNLSLPIGTTFACASLYIDACTFTADCDWRGLSVTPKINNVAANLNGHVLTLNNLEVDSLGSSFSNTSATDGEVRFYADGNPANVTEATFVTGIAHLTTTANAKIAIVRTNASTASGSLNIGAAHNHTVFRINDGTVTASSNGSVGSTSGGTGYLEVEGGAVNVNVLYVGHAGTGTCTQNGGDVKANNGDVVMGQNSGAIGTYTLNNGTLEPKSWLHVGFNGRGSFIQNGGTITSNRNGDDPGNWVCLAENASGNGTYIMNGGSLEVGTGGGGGIFPGRRGTGRFELNGGTILTPAIVGQTGRSTFVLNGGTIKVSKDSGTRTSNQYTGEYGIFKDIENLVLGGRATTIDTNGHDTKILNCGYAMSSDGSALVKSGAGKLTVDVVPPVDTLTVSNGTFAVSADADNTATAWLAHRWSFNNSSYADSVGGLTATKTGSPTFSDGMIVLPGGNTNSGNIDLGANALSVGTDDVVIEIWAQQNTANNYGRIFDYYPDPSTDNRNNDFYMAWNTGANSYTTDKIEVKTGGSVKFAVTHSMQPYEQGTKYHISMSFHDNGDGSTTVSWAKRNVTTGVVEKSDSRTIANWTLSSFHSVANGTPHLYLGRSLYSIYGDKEPGASYDEVRVWRGVLSEAALTFSAQKGPDATAEEIAEIMAATSAATPATRTLELNSAATLEIASGTTFTQPVVKGNGTVSGGTLKVADSLVVKCGETLLASGTVDLTGAKVVLSDPENLASTGSFKFLKAPAGQTLSIVGKPTVVGLPKGWYLNIRNGSAGISRGFVILVK